MRPLILRRFWQTRRRLAFVLSMCFCVLGLAPATYGQTDSVDQLIDQLHNPNARVRVQAAESKTLARSSHLSRH
jgi:hypothetical protein